MPTRKPMENPLKNPLCREVLGKLIEMLESRDRTYQTKVDHFEQKHSANLRGVTYRALAEFLGETPAFYFIEKTVGPNVLLNQFPRERRTEVKGALNELVRAKLVSSGLLGGPLVPTRSLEPTELARTLIASSEQPDYLPAQ